ncbi:hypothetical protein LR48_Vigan10g229200 [Vigna angularis]|uniref:Uncharacterized protein n=1 Tax=Phaseolus angularis TaxID=3914 RepID=A0A0L9VMX0_PHAAN|nr:hypothetical protein LR48_Vigan10g229200 [Vigna angularis]
MPSAAQGRSSQRGRSPRISGRSSRVEARADARPEGQKRTFVQPGRTLVQPGRTLVQRRENWTFVQLAEVDVRPASRKDARPVDTLGQREKRGLSASEWTLGQRVDARPGEVDARPEEDAQWTLSQAEVDARPERQRSSTFKFYTRVHW